MGLSSQIVSWSIVALFSLVPEYILWLAHQRDAAVITLGSIVLLTVISLVNSTKSAKANPCISSSPTLEELKLMIDEYFRQRVARRRQHPWLALSLVAYCTTYGLIVFPAAAQGLPSGLAAACFSVALLAMFRAGEDAEDNPAKEGFTHVDKMLKSYLKTFDTGENSFFMERIRTGTWSMEDLRTYAQKESDGVGLSSVKFSQASRGNERPPVIGMMLLGAVVGSIASTIVGSIRRNKGL